MKSDRRFSLTFHGARGLVVAEEAAELLGGRLRKQGIDWGGDAGFEKSVVARRTVRSRRPVGSDRVGSEEVQHLLPWAHRNAQLLEVAFVQMDDGVEGDLLYGECLGKGAQAIGGEQRAQTINRWTACSCC